MLEEMVVTYIRLLCSAYAWTGWKRILKASYGTNFLLIWYNHTAIQILPFVIAYH